MHTPQEASRDYWGRSSKYDTKFGASLRTRNALETERPTEEEPTKRGRSPSCLDAEGLDSDVGLDRSIGQGRFGYIMDCLCQMGPAGCDFRVIEIGL